MSPDQEELWQSLPEIQLPAAIEINPTRPSDATICDNIITIHAEKIDVDDDDCHTPTGVEHRIPAILECPWAPKRPKKPMYSRRRNLWEQEQIMNTLKLNRLSGELRRRLIYSQDLQYPQSLPRIRLPAIEINSPQPSDLTSDEDDDDDISTIPSVEIDIDEADCHTPTGPEHRIPAFLKCPPAPKKPYYPLKRKLPEPDQKMKIVIDEAEMERFFRDFEAKDDSNKRRCPPSS